MARDAKGPFSVQPIDALFSSEGGPHPKYRTFGDYQKGLLLRSTETLFSLEPAVTVLRTFPIPRSASIGVVPAGPAWPHTHTMDVESDDVHVDTGQGICLVNNVTITGYLQWQRGSEPIYCIMEEIPGGDAFAGAMIAPEKQEGHMTALVFSPKTRDIGVHFVRLSDEHLNCIRELRLESGRI